MKAIQKELSQKDDFHKELDAMRAKIKKNGLPPHVAEEANKEIDRLSKMQPFSPEATIVSKASSSAPRRNIVKSSSTCSLYRSTDTRQQQTQSNSYPET